MSHIYEKNGKTFPSVTTVLHILGDHRLIKWANVMGFQRKNVDLILKESSSFGTMVHKALEYYVKNEDWKTHTNPLLSIRLESVINRFEAAFPRGSYETVLTEVSMANEELEYGGTSDWIMKQNGETIICDFKTSKMVYPYMQLQLAAYAKLLELEKDIKVNKAMIILINENFCRSTTYSLKDLERGFEAFMYLLKFYSLFGDKLS